MSKCVSNIFSVYLFSIMFLLVISLGVLPSVNAVTITSVSVDELDVFYSNYTGNSVAHLKVNVSNVTSGNTVTVTADFSNLGVNVCAGNSNNTISLVDSGNGVWTGECDLGNIASQNSFKTGQILIDARESNGGPTSPQGSIAIGVYNVGIPQGNSCYRFTEGSTNFAEENNFNSIDITLVVQAYGSSSCVTTGNSWGDNWMTIGKIRFLGVNLADPAKASKITSLLDVVKINYSAPKSNQNNGVHIDATSLPELSTNTFIELYRLPFISQPTIISDNSVPSQAVTWSNNGIDSILNYTTFNVSFTATPGFAGYTVTDNSAPIITLTSPTLGQNYNDTVQIISATINGTKTELKQVSFYINNILAASFLGTIGGTNTANCVASSSNSEVYTCTFNVTRLDGIYNLTIVAHDYGLGNGNNATTMSNYIVQTGGPVLVAISPSNGSTYHDTEGSVMKLNFTASDGNGISRCWYTIASGSSSQSENIFVETCNVSVETKLYLMSSDYTVMIYANDTLGRTSSKALQFSVSDDNAPVLTDNTKANGSLKKTTLISINTDENATCKYDITDVSFNKMKNSFTDKILSHNVTVNTSTNDTYKFYVRCEDMSENSNTNSLVINLGEADSTTVNETVKDEFTDPHEIIDLGLINAGQHIVEITEKNIAMTDLLISTIGLADDVVLTVSVPSKPSAKYAGTVYQYIEIAHGSLKDSLVSGVQIKFSVDNKWFSDNKLNASEISLYRYDNGKWSKLTTSVTKVTTSKTEFVAQSPGLSLFAISSEEKIVVAPVVATKSNNSNSTADSLLKEIVSVPEGKSSLVWWLIAILVFVLLALYIVAEINYRNGPPPIFPREKTPWAKIKKLFR